MKKRIVIQNIADIHFGKTGKEKELYESLKKHFIQRCIDTETDIIFINGDSYDSRQLINSDANIYFNKFIDDCVSTGAIVVILNGTESHDRYQINALAYRSSDRFFIVNTVTELTLCGLKFLLLPEEYVRSQTYYDEYLSKKYDFVQFHGMFSHIGFGTKGNVENVRHPYVFNWKQFAKNIKYYVVGGHIHTHSVYKNIIYSGSFGRLNFGEEEDKGWVECVVENNKCFWKFLVNTDAMTFTTILASSLPKDVDSMMKMLRGYQEYNDFLRIDIDVDDSNIINNIEGFVKNHKNCVIKRGKKKGIELTEKISKNLQEKQDKLDTIMKEFKGMDFIQITQKIAKDEYRREFTREEIYDIINTKV